LADAAESLLEEGEILEELEEGETREDEAAKLQEASKKMLGIVQTVGYLYK
jgi:hypothetical protein